MKKIDDVVEKLKDVYYKVADRYNEGYVKQFYGGVAYQERLKKTYGNNDIREESIRSLKNAASEKYALIRNEDIKKRIQETYPEIGQN